MPDTVSLELDGEDVNIGFALGTVPKLHAYFRCPGCFSQEFKYTFKLEDFSKQAAEARAAKIRGHKLKGV